VPYLASGAIEACKGITYL